MSKTKAISDEQVIAALIEHGTIKAAAAAVGLSERAVYERMSGGDFQALYKSARADILRGAVLHMNRQLQASIDTVAEIMQDTNNNPAVRLQAAQTIMTHAAKFSQRLQAAEAAVATQQDINKFFV